MATRKKRRMVLQDFMCYFLNPTSHGIKDKAGKPIKNGDILCVSKTIPPTSWHLGDVEIGIVSNEHIYYFTTFGGEGHDKLSDWVTKDLYMVGHICEIPKGLYWRCLVNE